MAKLLMPKATAVWLVENTVLTFDQISEFCGLHKLEIQGIADGEVASGMQGISPVFNKETTKEAIQASEADADLPIEAVRIDMPKFKQKGPKYTPLSRRQDKPDAIAWLTKFYPKLTDQHIIKLIGTTKTTIQSIRTRSHWNSTNIKPRDPVLLSLCRQSELNILLEKTGSLQVVEPEVVHEEPKKVDEDKLKDVSYYFSEIDQNVFNKDADEKPSDENIADENSSDENPVENIDDASLEAAENKETEIQPDNNSADDEASDTPDDKSLSK